MRIKIGKLTITWGDPMVEESEARIKNQEIRKKILDLIAEDNEPPYMKQVRSYLREGQKLMAVKAYRDGTGEDLRESKRVVMSMYDKMIINIKSNEND